MPYTLDFKITGADGRPLQSIADVVRDIGARTAATSGELRVLDSVLKANAASGMNLAASLKLVSESSDSFQKNIRSAAKELLGHTEAAGAAGVAVRGLATEHEQAATRIERAMARIGGRMAGGASGVPGGGFMGSQLVGALGLGAGGAMGLAGVGAGIFAAIDISRQVEQLAKQAEQWKMNGAAIGLTAQQMELMSRVSERTGVNLEGAAKSMSALREKLIEGGAGADKIRGDFENLGISAATAFKDPVHAIDDIVHSLSQIKDPVERSQRGFELLGESGRQLAAVADDFDKLRQRSSQGILDPEAQKRLEEARQAMQDLHEAWQGVITLAAKPVTFTLTFVGDLPSSIGKWAESVKWAFAHPFSAQSNTPGSPVNSPTDIGGPMIPPEADTEAAQAQDAAGFLGNYWTQRYDAKDRAGTAEDPYGGRIKDVTDQLSGLRGQNLKGGYGARRDQLETQLADLKEKQSVFQARRGQVRELQRMTGPDTDQEANRLFQELPKRFELATDSPEYKAWYQTLQPGALKNFSEAGGRMFRGQTADELTRKGMTSMTGEDRLFSGDLSRGTRDATELGRSAQGLLGADNARRTAIAGGATGMMRARGGMTPAQLSQLDFAEQLAQIQQQFQLKAGPLQAAMGVPGLPAEDKQSKLDELNTLKIDADTKLIEATNKLNEAFATSARKLDEEFSNSIIGLIMGAQKGGGRGARSAAISMGEGWEQQILKNIIGPGGLMPIQAPSLTSGGGIFGKLLQGTPFGARPDDAATRTAAATEGMFQIMQGKPATPGGSIMSLPGVPNWLGGLGIPGLTSSGGAFESGGLSSIAGSMSSAARASTGVGGISLANIESVFSGYKAVPGTNGDVEESVSGASRIGTAAAGAAAALGIFQGIQTMSRGGAKSVASGLGEGLMAASVFTGPAMPFVAAAGAVAALVGAILPDPKVTRGLQIQKAMFTQQYLAPPAINMTASGNAGYADVDQYGNVRTSNLSPYPIVSDPYLDVPRRTVVPGHPVSAFGGSQNVTGAKVGPPVFLTIHAMDSKSILDRGSDITAAVHKAIQSGTEPLVHTLAQQLGIR